MPRVPILPYINVAWYIPVIVIAKYIDIPDNIGTKLLKTYIAIVFITWGLEGDPKQKIRLDWYFQCYIFGQGDRCDDIWGVNKTTNSEN